MFKTGLQLFAEAVAGKKIVYLYRLAEKAKTEAAKNLAFTTENGRTKSKDAEVTATKDGSIRTPGAAETEITAKAVLSKGDKLIAVLKMLWTVINLSKFGKRILKIQQEPGPNKFKGMYFQGYLTEVEITSSAEENVEVSLTFGINGSGKRGDVTVTTQQQEVAAYVFKDTTQES